MSMLSEHVAPQRALLFERRPTDTLIEDDQLPKSERPVVKRVAQKSEMLRPCEHNKWTKQTKKRGKLVLRCLECSVMWKTYPEFHTKCPDFHAGECPRGNQCEHPHVYARREAKKKDAPDHDVIVPVKAVPTATTATTIPQENTTSDPNPYPASYYSAYEGTSGGYVPDYSPPVAHPAPTSYLPTYYAAYEGGAGAYCQPDYQPAVAAEPAVKEQTWTHDPYTTFVM